MTSIIDEAEESDILLNPQAKPEKVFKFFFCTGMTMFFLLNQMTECLRWAKNRLYWWNLHEQKLKEYENKSGRKVDLLLCCGDFQSHRNPADFHSSSIPPKYRRLGTFPKYYAGEKKAPILTLFIGGNHEASQPLRELYYGGWAAPNIYYMGAASVVRYGGIRIGGISGIYKSHDYQMGHFGKKFESDSLLLRKVVVNDTLFLDRRESSF